MQTKSMTQIGVLCFLLITIVLSSNCASISKEYVAADKATYQAIAPKYSEYCLEDSSLTQLEKDMCKELIKSWEERITAAEDYNGK